MLAFAELDRNSVEAVWFGGYGALQTAVIANQLDCFGSVTTSAHVREIEASTRGVAWPGDTPDNNEGWDRITQVATFLQPQHQTVGTGISHTAPTYHTDQQ